MYQVFFSSNKGMKLEIYNGKKTVSLQIYGN